MKILLALFICFLTACSHSYYVVRHAEKEASPAVPSDPSLSTEGTQRAVALREMLKGKKIAEVYVTKTKRATETGSPLAESLGITPQFYGPVPDQQFLEQLKKTKRNTLIVGHSNTVDDIVNSLAGKNVTADLKDSEYSNLFIITYKKKGVQVQQKSYGANSNN